MSFSLDANLLIYASDKSSPFHPAAKQFLVDCLNGFETVYIAWPTAMAYLRIVTHPSIFSEPLPPREATRNIEALQQNRVVRFITETEDFWAAYQTISHEQPIRGNLVPDAHLAALLKVNGVKTLYTHDRDFRRFDFLRIKDPLA